MNVFPQAAFLRQGRGMASKQDDENAEVAELADALASGASDRKIIRVQIPSSARTTKENKKCRITAGRTVRPSSA